MKLFPNFTSIPFDYLLISWVTNYAHNRGFLTCLFYRELQALKSLKTIAYILAKVHNFLKFSTKSPFESFLLFIKSFKVEETVKSSLYDWL